MAGGVGEDGLISVSVAIVGKGGVCSVDIVEEEDPKWRSSPVNEDDEQ